MAAYPATLPSGATWRVPFTRTLEFRTKIGRGLDSTEQRWAETCGRERWTLTYRDLVVTDRDAIFASFETAKGDFDQTLSLTWGGTTYSNVYFQDGKLDAQESDKPARSSMKVVLCQLYRAADTGTLGTFPLLSSGARVQLPYSYSRAFDNVSVETDGGRYSYYNRASSYRTWTVGGPFLLDTEAQALWDFFRRARGKLTTFAFVDPDSGTSYPSCRFGSDQLDWTINGRDNNALQTTVEQFA